MTVAQIATTTLASISSSPHGKDPRPADSEGRVPGACTHER
jgi:hypothetical protein